MTKPINMPICRKSEEIKKGPRPPVFWNATEANDFKIDTWGQYPKGFLSWAFRLMGVRSHSKVIHVCSGALDGSHLGVRVDLRPGVCPDVVADGERLPFIENCFDFALIDPPYTEEYAKNLYGTKYPKPQRLLREASRVICPGGLVGFLHFQMPLCRRPLGVERVYGVTTGPGYAARAFTLLRKYPKGLY